MRTCSPAAIDRLPEICNRFYPEGRLLCIVDENTWKTAGKKAASLLSESGRETGTFFLDGIAQPAHADKESVDAVVARVLRYGYAGIVAIGSGTINDVCKSASTETDVPQITVATAASMNGYPSAISALTVDGVKITAPCKPPVAIIADPLILAAAAREMTGAGFGDLLSQNASTADWRMSHILFDEYDCDFSATLAEAAVNQCIARAADIRAQTPEALSTLAEAPIRSGISMVVAGSSSPASGGEHLISHLWDMTAHWTGRPPALHGQQTGATTLISLRLYENLTALDHGDLRDFCSGQLVSPNIDETEQEIRMVFGDLAEAILPYARKKILDADQLKARRKLIMDRWGKIRQSVSQIHYSRRNLAKALAYSRNRISCRSTRYFRKRTGIRISVRKVYPRPLFRIGSDGRPRCIGKMVSRNYGNRIDPPCNKITETDGSRQSPLRLSGSAGDHKMLLDWLADRFLLCRIRALRRKAAAPLYTIYNKPYSA